MVSALCNALVVRALLSEKSLLLLVSLVHALNAFPLFFTGSESVYGHGNSSESGSHRSNRLSASFGRVSLHVFLSNDSSNATCTILSVAAHP